MGGVGQVGFGPLWRIDGPLPQPPAHSLLDVARIVDDTDGGGIERWGNGVVVYGYPTDQAGVWDACVGGSDTGVKADGAAPPLPQFGAMTVYLPETCSSFGIWGQNMSNDQAQARFIARATAAFTAVESSAVEEEFMTGNILGLNPHLANGSGTINGTAQSVVQSFAELENAIAATGKKGVIHCSPAAATIARANHIIPTPDAGKPGDVLYTVNGTPVVPGYGYVGNSRPAGGHPNPGAHQEYMYATGPIEIRRSQVVVFPEEVWMALDRSTNTITYRAERYYVVDWDTALQYAVFTDRTL